MNRHVAFADNLVTEFSSSFFWTLGLVGCTEIRRKYIHYLTVLYSFQGWIFLRKFETVSRWSLKFWQLIKGQSQKFSNFFINHKLLQFVHTLKCHTMYSFIHFFFPTTTIDRFHMDIFRIILVLHAILKINSSKKSNICPEMDICD